MKVKRVLYDWQGEEFDELSVRAGQVVLEDESYSCEKGWSFCLTMIEAAAAESGGEGIKSGIVPKEFLGEAYELFQCRALFGFEGNSPEELSFEAEEIISIYEAASESWWIGGRGDSEGKEEFGFVPVNYLSSSTSQECTEKEHNHSVGEEHNHSGKEEKHKGISAIDMDSFLMVQSLSEDPFLRYIEGSTTLSTEQLMQMRCAFGGILVEGMARTAILLAFSQDSKVYLIVEKGNSILVSFDIENVRLRRRESERESGKTVWLVHENEVFEIEMEKEADVGKLSGFLRLESEGEKVNSVEWNEEEKESSVEWNDEKSNSVEWNDEKSNSVEWNDENVNSVEWNDENVNSVEWNDEVVDSPQLSQQRIESLQVNHQTPNSLQLNHQTTKSSYLNQQTTKSPNLNHSIDKKVEIMQSKLNSVEWNDDEEDNEEFTVNSPVCNQQIQSIEKNNIESASVKNSSSSSQSFSQTKQMFKSTGQSNSFKVEDLTKEREIQPKANQFINEKEFQSQAKFNNVTKEAKLQSKVNQSSNEKQFQHQSKANSSISHESPSNINQSPSRNAAIPESNLQNLRKNLKSVPSSLECTREKDNFQKESSPIAKTQLTNDHSSLHKTMFKSPNDISSPRNSAFKSSSSPTTNSIPSPRIQNALQKPTRRLPQIPKEFQKKTTFIPPSVPEEFTPKTTTFNSSEQSKTTLKSSEQPKKAFNTPEQPKKAFNSQLQSNATFHSQLQSNVPLQSSVPLHSNAQLHSSSSAYSREQLIAQNAKISPRKNPQSIRLWRDKTGAFSTEAVYIQSAGGKVHLRKANGTNIFVPLDSLSTTDIDYLKSIEPETFSHYFSTSYNNFDWLKFLTCGAGIPNALAIEYAQSFVREKMDVTCIGYLDRQLLKSFGFHEGDAIKVLRACSIYLEHLQKTQQQEHQAYLQNIRAIEMAKATSSPASAYPVLKAKSLAERKDRYSVLRDLDPLSGGRRVKK